MPDPLEERAASAVGSAGEPLESPRTGGYDRLTFTLSFSVLTPDFNGFEREPPHLGFPAVVYDVEPGSDFYAT